MCRSILILSFLSLLLANCHTEIVGIFVCEKDTPVWLKAKIEPTDALYGTRVYRYEWRGESVYYIENPISSCAYCELYDQDGAKIQLTDDPAFQDFLMNSENRTLICEWRR